MPRNVTLYTTAELTEMLGGVSKNYLSQVMREIGGERVTGYTFDPYDLWPYLRRQLLERMGVKAPQKIQHDDWDKDDSCPVCGAFAIYRPASPEEIKNLDLDVYGPSWPWSCINGHNEESEE